MTYHIQHDPEEAVPTGILEWIQWPTLIGNSFAQSLDYICHQSLYLSSAPIDPVSDNAEIVLVWYFTEPTRPDHNKKLHQNKK